MGSDDSTSSRFEELKEQYEETGSFEEEAATEPTEDSTTSDSASPDTAAEEPATSSTTPQPAPAEPDDDETVTETNAAATATETDETAGAIEEPTTDQAPTQRSVPEPTDQLTAATHDGVGEAEATGRPYLEPIPSGYWAERRVIEWLEFLVATGGTDGAGDAIDFYRSVGWIGPRAETRLKEYLTIFPETTADQSMTYDDHRQSLEYIAALSGRRQRL